MWDAVAVRAMMDRGKQVELRMCPSCGNGVQKSVGCMSMVCRCSAKFCYTCGLEWKGASRCSCPGMH